jgi:hypothetical protein
MASRSCVSVIMAMVKDGDDWGGGRGGLKGQLLAQFVSFSQVFSAPVSTTAERERGNTLEKSKQRGGIA